MIWKKISLNKREIMEKFNNTSDLVLYEFETNSNIKMMACYIEGFIDRELFDRDILKPLILDLKKVKDIKRTILTSKIKEIDSMENLIEDILSGNIAIFAEDLPLSYTIELSKWEKRAVEEPESEPVVRGPKEGFIEDIFVNKSLLRRKLRTNNLVFEDLVLGKQTRTKISIAYLQGIVNKRVLEEVKKRLSKIDIDGVLESGYIEQLIEDRPYSIIATIENTEKPDVAAAKILEGRVAILCDGTPHVLTVPRLFIEGVMTSEDYYVRPYYASFLRFLRVTALLISVFSPGVYVALQLYHQEMIPTVLLISMMGAREGVPLPVALETLLMVLTLEVTKESGVRLPKAVGTTVSIVGTLVLGQAAVQAGIVSAPTVIIIAITAISEFVVPALVQGVVLYRLIILLLGSFLGLYGTTCGLIIYITQIITTESFGIPFGFPLTPINKEGLKDSIVRFPIWSFIYRPKAIAKRNIRRQKPPRKG
ncbi:spore germination protein [Clostridium sp. Cult1]|uniref:spore germination protein n=1 Tax=Clostridium sp. Cult1 TaxID=2079002 RepID=UPI001F47463D|nr:spore germination protein [Clostridium sp. Cult1]MCF6463585.1 spore germination protein [Clostridium sp. Cult1]